MASRSPLARARLAWRRGKGQPFLTRALSTFGGLFGSPAASGYAGGRLTRLSQDWVMLPLSADQELRWNIRALRARARELVRDTPLAKRFIHLVAQNVVGPHGVRLQGRVTTLQGDPHQGVNATLEREWQRWGRAGSCTVDGRCDFSELQRLVMKTVAQDGECIIRMIRGFDNPWAFALQLIDADQLDHMYNRAGNAAAGENEIRLGVELDQWRRPVAYHLWSGHPSEYEYDQSRERVRVPANEIIHLYVSHRVGQTRGVSWFHPVLLQLKMLDGYHEAELVASRTAAAKFWVIETSADDGYQAPLPGEKVDMEVEPGMLTELDPGKTIKPLDPQHPTQAFEQFTKAILKGVSAGLGVTYADLAGDLAEANYANQRTGLLAARDEYRALQQWLIEHFHRPVYEAWLSMAILAGRVKPGMRDPEGLQEVAWVPRGFDWVDPLNDLRAKALEIDYGLTSRTQVAAERGEDLAQIFAELALEQQLAKENDLALAPMTVKPTSKAPTESNPAPAEQDGGASGNGGGNGGGRLAVLEALRRPVETDGAAAVAFARALERAVQAATQPQPAPTVVVEGPTLEHHEHVTVEAARVEVQPATVPVTVILQTPQGDRDIVLERDTQGRLVAHIKDTP